MDSSRNVNKQQNSPKLKQATRQKSTTRAHEYIRVIVMGSPKVGKTSIVKQYLHQRFTEKYVSTIRDFHFINTDTIRLRVLDTGECGNTTIRNLAIGMGHAFVLVYAIDDERSFDHVTSLRNEIVSVWGNDVPIVVVGNTDREFRAVNPVNADCVVTMDWEIPHLEFSARDNLETRGIFEHLLHHRHFRSTLTNIDAVSESQKRNSLSCPLADKKTDKPQKRRRSLMNNGMSLLFSCNSKCINTVKESGCLNP